MKDKRNVSNEELRYNMSSVTHILEIWDLVRPLPSDTPEGGPSLCPFHALGIHVSHFHH